MPIFNRLSTENSLKIGKLNYLRSLESLEQARESLELSVRQTYLNLERQRRSVESCPTEAIRRPSEETATSITKPTCPNSR